MVDFNILVKAVNDPVILGELLRAYCFVGEGYGCYSTFDLRDEFKEVEDEIATNLLSFKDEWWGEGEEMSPVSYTNGDIVVSWLWDGDGTLYFRYDGNEIINTDCKKAYEWDFVSRNG